MYFNGFKESIQLSQYTKLCHFHLIIFRCHKLLVDKRIINQLKNMHEQSITPNAKVLLKFTTFYKC